MQLILMLDDDEDLLHGQRVFLESQGYRVVTATTSDSAIERIKEDKPDIIVADLMMEHYDTGFVFCNRVRGLPGMKDVPIIMQTAAARKVGFSFENPSPEQKKWMKVDQVLTKPVPLDELLGTIRQHLAKQS